MTIKKDIDKQIYQQSRDHLGQANINDPYGIIFTNTGKTSETINNIIWGIRYYYFDHGKVYSLDYNNFEKYAKNIGKDIISATNAGGILKYNMLANINIEFSVSVYVNDNRSITLPIECSEESNITIYKKEVGSNATLVSKIYGSKNKQININLSGGKWTNLYIYYYKQSGNGKIKAIDGLLNYINAWQPIDFISPGKPIWYNIPITTSSNPITLNTKNTLQWDIPNDFDWFGHNIYRAQSSTKGTVVNSDDTNIGEGIYLSTNNNYQSDSDLYINNRLYKIQKTKFVEANLLNNPGFEDTSTGGTNFISNWYIRSNVGSSRYLSTVTNENYVYNGISAKITSDMISTSKNIYLENSAYIPVNTAVSYRLGLECYGSQKMAVGFVYYSSSDGTKASTTSEAINFYTDNVDFINKEFLLSSRYNASDDDYVFILPDDCLYTKVRLYGVYGSTSASTAYFDAIKFGVKETEYTYTVNSSKKLSIIPSNNLSIKSNNYTKVRGFFRNTASPNIGNDYTRSDGLTYKNINNFPNIVGDGVAFRPQCTIRTDGLTGNCSTSSLVFTNTASYSISNNPSYGSLYGDYVGVITKTVSTGNGYAYSAYINTNGPYWLSFYAKKKTADNIYFGVHADDGSTHTTMALESEWQKYMIGGELAGNSTIKIGVPDGSTGSVLIDGVNFSNYHTPIEFCTRSVSNNEYIEYRAVDINTSSGYISLYYYPSFDVGNHSNTFFPIFTIYSSANPSGMYNNVITSGYHGTHRKFTLEVHNSSLNNFAYSTSQSFDADDKISVQCTWSDNRIKMYINGVLEGNTAYSGNFTYPLNRIIIGNRTIFGINYNSCGTISDFKYDAIPASNKSLNYHNSVGHLIPSASAVSLSEFKHLHTRFRQGTDTESPLIYEDQAVIPGTRYIYVLDCFDKSGNRSELSATAAIVTGDNIPPDIVTGATAIGGYQQINVKWTNPSDVDFAGVRIYEKTAGGSYSDLDDVYGLPGNSNSWIYSGLDNNVSTSLFLRTFDNNLNYDDTYTQVGPVSTDGEISNLWIRPVQDEKKWYTNNQSYTIKYESNTSISSKDIDFIDGGGTERTLTSVSYSTVRSYNTGGKKIYLHSASFTTPGTITEGDGSITLIGMSGITTISDTHVMGIDTTSPNTFNISFSPYSVIDSSTSNSNTVRIYLNNIPSDDLSGVDRILISNNSGFTSTATSIHKLEQGDDIRAFNHPISNATRGETYNIYTRLYDKAGNYRVANNQPISYVFQGAALSVNLRLMDGHGTFASRNSVYSNENGWYKKSTLNNRKYVRISAQSEDSELSRYFLTSKKDGYDFTISDEGALSGLSSSADVPFLDNNGSGFYEFNCRVEDEDANASYQTLRVNFDRTLPDTSDSIFTDNCRAKSRGTHLEFDIGNLSDPQTSPDTTASGLWKLDIFRKRSSESFVYSSPLATLLLNDDDTIRTYTDFEDNLEGYVTFDYNARVYDRAGNYITETGPSIVMTPDWEATYKNWLHNGSFDIYVGSSVEGWYQDGSVSHNTTDHLFGAASMNIGTPLYNYIMQETFLPQYNSSNRWIISCYIKGTTRAAYISISLRNAGTSVFDYQNSMTYVETVQDNNGNSWRRFKYILDASGWGSTIQTATSIMIRFMADANAVIDGCMMELVEAGVTSPSRFIDNRVLTTDRFMAGFIYANMIKAEQIHAGHIVADGLDVVSSGTNTTPRITVGDHWSDIEGGSLTSLGNFTLINDKIIKYHQDSMNGYFTYMKHIEYGIANFGDTVTFDNAYANTNDENYDPIVFISPINVKTYDKDYSGSDQFVTTRVEHGTTGVNFTAYYNLIAGSYEYTEENVTGGTLTFGTPKHETLAANSQQETARYHVSITWGCGESPKYGSGGWQSVTLKFYADGGLIDTRTKQVSDYSGTIEYVFEVNHSNIDGAGTLGVEFDARSGGGLNYPTYPEDVSEVVYNSVEYSTSGGTSVHTDGQYMWVAFDGGVQE